MTFTYVFVSVPVQLALALALAMLLDKGIRGLSIYRSVYYLPSLLGSSVAIALLWKRIFGADGLFNQFLAIFGIEGQAWISDPDTALGTLITLNVWTFGAPDGDLPGRPAADSGDVLRGRVLLTAPAGGADSGRSRCRCFPRSSSSTSSCRSSTPSSRSPRPSSSRADTGGPADSTMFYTLYLYQKGFGQLQMGYASAMAWVLLVIIAIFTGINFYFSKKWVFYDD